MTSTAKMQTEPQPITACTVSRDVQNFDLLIEDMEDALGERWGDLSFEDAEIFLGQPDADGLSFIAIAIDAEDEGNLAKVQRVISSAKGKDIKVILSRLTQLQDIFLVRLIVPINLILRIQVTLKLKKSYEMNF